MGMLDAMKGASKKAKTDREARDKQFQKVKIFKPDPGDNSIRLLPHWDVKVRKGEGSGEEVLFSERKMHYLPVRGDDGNEYTIPMTCLSHFDKPCPACKVAAKIKKDNPTKARKIGVTRRFFYNIIAYGDETQAMVYPMPPSVHTDLLSEIEDAGVEVWSPSEGRDIRIKRTNGKRPQDVKYKVYIRPETTKVPPKLLKQVIEEMANLDELWFEDDEKKMLKGLKIMGLLKYLSSDSRDEDEDEEEEEEKPKFKKKPKKDEEEEEPEEEEESEEEEDEEEEEEEDEEEESEEEEEEEKKPKSKKDGKKKPKKDEEEESDLDIEKELERLGV